MGILSRLFGTSTPPQPAAGRDLLRRGFDGASGSRWVGNERLGSVAAETLNAGQTIQSRARYIHANNPWASAGVAALTAALVGPGIRAAGSPEATAAFDRWAAVADAESRTDLWGLQAAAVRGLAVDGESFLLLEDGPEGLRVRLLPPELVDSSCTMNLAGGGYVIGGIEFSAGGRRVAYYVFQNRPDLLAANVERIRIPASEILHLCRPLGAGQVRGVSWLAPVLLRLRELDILEDALAKGVAVAALHAGFLVDQNGAPAAEPFEDAAEVSLEPGMIRRLPAGYDIRFSTPQQASQTSEFVHHQIRAIAAGLGVPAHMVDGDLRGANYSSLRAGLVAFRQRIEQDQFGCIIPQLVAPLFERVTGESAAEFYPPAQPWVDPLKDTEATVAAMAAGLMSRRQAVAALGYDVERLDREIAADRTREAALGLAFGMKPADQKESPDAL